MNEFLTFRRFITPVLIQVIFWATTALAVIALLVAGVQQGGAAIVAAMILIPVVMLTIRVYCELLIILFKIYEALVELRGGRGGPMGFPMQPPVPQPHYPPQA